MNKKVNLHRSYKKVIGASVACLSMFASLAMGGNTAEAATVNLKPQIVQAVSYTPEKASLVEQVKEVVADHGLLGVPYVTGGTTTKGFDCSGFTQYVFKELGVNLPRVSRDQANIDKSSAFKGQTTTVTNKNDVEAGDLVFFSNTPGRVSHVGIALEDNKYVHASVSGSKILVATRAGSYYNGSFTKAIRINQ